MLSLPALWRAWRALTCEARTGERNRLSVAPKSLGRVLFNSIGLRRRFDRVASFATTAYPFSICNGMNGKLFYARQVNFG